MSVRQHSIPELIERQRRVRDRQRKDFVGPQALKIERIGTQSGPKRNDSEEPNCEAVPVEPSACLVFPSVSTVRGLHPSRLP